MSHIKLGFHMSVVSQPLNIAVLTISDTRTLENDKSGDYLKEALTSVGHNLYDRDLVKDDIYQQRAVVSRSMLVSTFALGLSFALPAISSANTQKVAEADFREQTMRFAETQDGGEAVRADPRAPAVMTHEWMRNVEYSLERDPDSATTRYGGLERDAAVLPAPAAQRRLDAPGMLVQL
jgi:hypothetical protein